MFATFPNSNNQRTMVQNDAWLDPRGAPGRDQPEGGELAVRACHGTQYSGARPGGGQTWLPPSPSTSLAVWPQPGLPLGAVSLPCHPFRPPARQLGPPGPPHTWAARGPLRRTGPAPPLLRRAPRLPVIHPQTRTRGPTCQGPMQEASPLQPTCLSEARFSPVCPSPSRRCRYHSLQEALPTTPRLPAPLCSLPGQP